MSNACHEGLIAKFDQLITKLQQRIMKKERLQVSENGTYTAPENTGYTVVDVNVQGGAPVDTRTPEPITITGNGVTDVPDDKVYTPITVAVPTYAAQQVTANGKLYTENKIVDGNIEVAVPNNITFERFTGRYSKSNKNFSSALTNFEAVVSNAVMDVDELPLTRDMQNISFLAVFYGKLSANVITDIRCKMEVSPQTAYGSAGADAIWEVPLKMSHVSQSLDDGKYAYMAQFGVRLSDFYPNGRPIHWTSIKLNKIYTEVKTSGAMQVEAGSVTTITAIANT